MKGTEFKENGFIAWSYRWISGNQYESLPNSLCEITWTVLFSWLFMILTLPSLCILLFSKKYREKPDINGITIFLTQMVIIAVLIALFVIIGKITLSVVSVGIISTLLKIGRFFLHFYNIIK